MYAPKHSYPPIKPLEYTNQEAGTCAKCGQLVLPGQGKVVVKGKSITLTHYRCPRPRK